MCEKQIDRQEGAISQLLQFVLGELVRGRRKKKSETRITIEVGRKRKMSERKRGPRGGEQQFVGTCSAEVMVGRKEESKCAWRGREMEKSEVG